jgi:hypothetical protein
MLSEKGVLPGGHPTDRLPDEIGKTLDEQQVCRATTRRVSASVVELKDWGNNAFKITRRSTALVRTHRGVSLYNLAEANPR